VNYEAHYSISWFKPLIRGNSLASSGLILKMKRCYKGVSRELKKLGGLLTVHPPPSDPHVSHTPLELWNLCVNHFEPAWLTCSMHVSCAGSELSIFEQPCNVCQSVLFMMTCEVKMKFR
jgi:hypothetical protein